MILNQSDKVQNGSHKIHPKNTRTVPSKIKIMLITFFNRKGIIHIEFVPTKQTITGQYILAVLKRLMARLWCICSEYRNEAAGIGMKLRPIHTSLIVHWFLVTNSICMLNYPLYSPDLAPCDYSFFPKLKMKLKRVLFWGYFNHTSSFQVSFASHFTK